MSRLLSQPLPPGAWGGGGGDKLLTFPLKENPPSTHHSFRHDPKLMTVGEYWSKDQ